MPRLACKEAKEYRFTLGDYERQQLVKPIGQLLDETNSAIRATKYLGYAAVAGGVVGTFFIAKGIAGVWDDFKDLIPTPPNFNPMDEDSVWRRISAWQRQIFEGPSNE